MTTPIQLIVGLANPGKQYADTRHNAGAWFIDEILAATSTSLKADAKFHGLHGAIKSDEDCHLLIPTTYMNLSGQALRACANYYKIGAENILVAHDDIDLPVGTIKLKFDGGDGGHNGLKDIIRHLNTKKFYRLRIGVGRPTTNKLSVVDYVLQPPSKSERQAINACLVQALDVLPLLLKGNIAQAMQDLHTNSDN